MHFGIYDVVTLLLIKLKHKTKMKDATIYLPKASFTTMEYAMDILPKVSFNKDLFKNELKKCIGRLEEEKIQELHMWCNKNFKEIYPDVLSQVFAEVTA
jgi:hypothetical protein